MSIPFRPSPELQALHSERETIVRELCELEVWLSLKNRVEPIAGHANWKSYRRERAEKTARYQTLSAVCGDLKAKIRELNITERDRRETSDVTRFYNAVAALEETGIDIGPELRALLEEYGARSEPVADTPDGA